MVISGASAGIGAATARLFASHGCNIALGARRTDRLKALAEEIRAEYDVDVIYGPLDVTSDESVDFTVASIKEKFGGCDILINNAGYAEGVDPFLATGVEQAQGMFETNVIGVLRLTRALVPGMIEQGSGQVVMLGSIAGRYFYEGGSIYCATKHALKAITGSLRLELVGTPIRINSIEPGMVETEFSIVRFRGDEDRADQVYEGIEPLTAADIAECIYWVCNRPAHVNIDDMLITPIAQGYTVKVARDSA